MGQEETQTQEVTLPEGHFGHEIQHEAFKTPEGKQYLSKYTSMDEALVGGFNASKMVGKKLENVIQKPGKDAKPEDLQAYHASLLKELGGVDDEKGLEDINFAEGLPDGAKTNDVLVADFKKFVVGEKVPKSLVAKMVKWNNAMSVKFAQAHEQAQLDAMNATNEVLMKDFGGEKGVAEATEMVKRMFAKNVAPDQFEAVGQALAQSGMTRDPILAGALMKMAQAYKEDATQTGEGNTGQKQQQTLEEKTRSENPKTSQALWPKG